MKWLQEMNQARLVRKERLTEQGPLLSLSRRAVSLQKNVKTVRIQYVKVEANKTAPLAHTDCTHLA